MRLLLAAALVCAASAGATASQELCAAAFDGNHEAVKKSLSNGVDVDYPCLTAAGTFTALHIASYHGHTEVLKVVLSWGAHANVVDSQGFHALYNAAGRNHGEIVRLLLENSEVNPFEATFNPGGFTVLHIAANHGHVAALEVLLEDGRLPIDGLDDEGRTPLYVAALNGHDEAVALLKEAERKGPAREQASEAFCVAAKRGDLKAVKKSLSNGIDVGYLCETTGATALWIASRAGHVDIVKLLISLGADTSVMEEGFHALYVAAQKGHPEVVRLLLEQVNPFDAISPKGFTALHVAARQTSIEALDTLLDDGRLPVDILSNDGQTSLYTAAREGSLRSVEVLLRHGADASFRKNGKTPADIASQSGHHEVAALLKEAEGRTPSERFCAAVVDGDVEALELTIRQGVDIEYQCPAAGTAGDASAASAAQSRIEALNGTETALYIASRAGHTDIVDVLLREGAAVNSPEGHTEVPGTTALHAAAGWGQTEVVELLLRAGGNASQGDAEGYTPLDNAASWGHQEVVAVLLDEAKVDVKSHDAKGAPMYYAAKYGRVEVIKLLLERGADPNLGPPAGSHPLYVAAEENHSDVVRVLLEVVDPHRAAWNSFSPLHVAAWHNCTEALEILVDDGRLPVDVLSTDGQSPLYVAARQGALRTRESHLLGSAQTTLLAARRVLAQRCKTTERSRFLLAGIGMLKNTCGKWHLSGGRAGRRAHRWPPDNRQTSTPPRRTSYASSGADLNPSSSFQTAPNGYSTSQEPESACSALVADALDA